MAENLSIPELFHQAVSKFADKVALQIKQDNQWQRFTYRDLEESSLGIATFLIKQGFEKSDTASLVLENRLEWAVIYLGISQAGLICVPLDPQFNGEDLKNLVIDSATKIIFCSFEVFRKKIKGNLENDAIKIVVLDMPDSGYEGVINFSTLKDMRGERNVMPKVIPQDIASLIYTSGTTGEPKGVLLTHANICSNFQSIVNLGICSYDDNVISILPLYHTYAFMVTLIVPLFLGATVTYLVSSFKPQEISQMLKEAQITVLVGVPQLFSILHKTIFERIKKIPFLFLPLALLFIKSKIRHLWGRNLRLLVSGGARLEPKVARDLSKILGVNLIEGYGLTETSPVVTLNPLQKIKWGSVGKPIPDVQIKILHPDAEGIGQVLIQGPNVMQGYFKHPEWTHEAIKEGWFYSGDLGYIDSEGYLFLVGREKEVIVLSSGKNIYPEELEEIYSRSPYIKEICILARDEEKFGRLIELLHAIVVPNLEYFQQKNETDIRGKIRWELENLAKNLPSYKHIMGFSLTKEELLRTALKKIKRYQIRQKYLGETAKLDTFKTVSYVEDLGSLNKDVAKKIIDYISGQLHKPVSLDSHLEIDLGIDSLTRVELALGLEKIFALKIPDEVLYNISTIKDVIKTISSFIDRSAPLAGKSEEMPRDWSQILSRAPQEKILRKIRIEPRFLDKLVTWIFKGSFLFILRLFWFLRIKGRKNLPLEGPYIICPNHASYLDGFVVSCALPLKLALNTYFLGYSAIFEHPLIRWAIKLARLIPIDPNIYLIDAMQAVSFVISQKKIVCIFPEGQRSIDESIGEFKKGVGILIKELDIPVVPVYIKGSHKSWPRTSRLPRFYPLKITFGRPLMVKELLQRKESGPDEYAVIAAGLRQEVLKLTN